MSGKKYVNAFARLELNDIRTICDLGHDVLKNDIGMKDEEIMRFLDKVEQYKVKQDEFSEWMKTEGVFDKYSGVLAENGITSFVAFFHFIQSPTQMRDVIRDEEDSQVLWQSAQRKQDDKRARSIFVETDA